MILFSFTPYLSAGFFADDAMNSQVNLVAKKQNISVLEFTNKIISNWKNDVGRYYPLGFLGSYTFYHLFPDELPARIVQMTLVLVNILLFSAMIYTLSGSSLLALTFIPILLLHFQLRDFYDPIAGYAPFMQLMFLYVVGAIMLFLHYLKSGAYISLIASGILFFASLLTYELSIVFFGIFALLARNQNKTFKSIFNNIKIHLFILCSYIAYIAYLRINRTSSYSGTEISKDLVVTIEAYLHQLGSMLPLSYFAANKSMTLSSIFSSEHDFIAAFGCALLTLLILITLFQKRENRQNISLKVADLFLICSGFVFLPPLVVALSARWQISVSAGIGYIPVYFSYYGSAFFISYFIINLLSKTPSKKDFRVIAALAIFTSISLINNLANQQSVEAQNSWQKYPRFELIRAYTSSELFRSVEPQAAAITTKPYGWNTIFLCEKSLSVFESILSASELSAIFDKAEQTKPIYFIDFRLPLTKYDQDQWVFLSKISAYEKDTAILNFLDPKFFITPASNTYSKLVINCLDVREEIAFHKGISDSIVNAKPFKCKLDNLNVSLE